MYHVHDKEPPPIENDGERPDHDQQTYEDNTDNANCKVCAPVLKYTCVSIQLMTCMNKNGEHNNNDNAPSDAYISTDLKRRNR